MPTSRLRSPRPRRSAASSSARRWADDPYEFRVRAERSPRLYRDHDPARHDARQLQALTTAAPPAAASAVAQGHGQQDWRHDLRDNRCPPALTCAILFVVQVRSGGTEMRGTVVRVA